MGFRESGETAKIELTYSITERHQQSGPSLETLIVCIIQVESSRQWTKLLFHPQGDVAETSWIGTCNSAEIVWDYEPDLSSCRDA